MTNDEIWVAVPRWEGVYEVSNLGRVRSLPRVGSCNNFPRNLRGRLLSTKRKAGKYPQVSLQFLGEYEHPYVHQIVMRAFVGDCPEGEEICHNDGNPSNCRLDNLRYDTPKGNNLDKARHGTIQRAQPKLRGEDNYNHVLKEDDVHFIRNNPILSLRYLGAFFGVDHTTISAIRRGKNWKYLDTPK